MARSIESSFDYTHEDENNNQSVVFRVSFRYHPGWRGDYMNPPESPEIEILSAWPKTMEVSIFAGCEDGLVSIDLGAMPEDERRALGEEFLARELEAIEAEAMGRLECCEC